MKALFLCPGLGLGGAERQWALLLPALADHGFDVRVLALNQEGPAADDLRRAGIDVHCARMRSRLDIGGLRRALALAGRAQDVVITRSVNAHLVGAFLARRAGAAHVATEHSEYDLLPLRAHQRLLVSRIAPFVEVAVCVTSAQIEPLVRLGYPASRIKVIPNAVRAEDLAPTRPRAETRRDLGVPVDAFVAVLLAALRPEKEPLDFVEAVTRAHAVDPTVRGVIVGDGTERAAVAAACAASGGAVRAVGSRRDIGDVLNAADVVCLTSRHEALPMVLLEALAVGKPIVATAVGGVHELVIAGETGELVEGGDVEAFAEALVSLAQDPARVARMGSRARQLGVDRFAFADMIDRYVAVLEAAEAGDRRRRAVIAHPQRADGGVE